MAFPEEAEFSVRFEVLIRFESLLLPHFGGFPRKVA